MNSHSLVKSFILLKALMQNRWMLIVAGFLIMSTSGATYNFGLYSGAIKSSLKYNQKTLNTISTFKDLGSKVGIISGFIYDFTGPWVVLLLGSSLNLFGYLMIWLAVTKKIAPPALWQMCLYMFLGSNSQAFTNTGVVVTTVKNFPHNRGFVIGLLKGFVGLSGAMLNLIYKALYGVGNPASFILLIAWFPTAVCTSLTFIIRRMPPSTDFDKGESEKKVLYMFLALSLVLAGYLMIIIIVEHLHGVTISATGFKVLATTMAVIILLSVPVAIWQEVQKWHHLEDKQVQLESTDTEADKQDKVRKWDHVEDKQVPIMDSEAEKQDDKTSSSPELTRLNPAASLWDRAKVLFWRKPPRGEDYTIIQAVFSVDMLIIFVCTTCGFGPALMAIDNLGQVGDALGYSETQVATFVSLLSIWNFLGRVGTGLTSDIVLRKYGTPRTTFFALVLGIAAIGHLLIAFNVPGALFMGSILIGLSYGGQLSLMYILISEIFGLRYYGTLYNVGNMASPLGSYIFSVQVAGVLYDREADKEGNRATAGDEDLFCHGTHCYRTTFAIMAGVCSFGFLVACILIFRTRQFYKDVSVKAKVAKSEQEEDKQQLMMPV